VGKNGLAVHRRRTPDCDVPVDLRCNKCNKEFSSKSNLKQHMLRKTPCVTDDITAERLLELEIKHKYDLEKINAKAHADLMVKEKIIDKKEKNELLRRKHDLEKIRLQTEKALAVEDSKLDRKKHTAQTINNIYIDQRNAQINNYHVNHPTENVLDATEENLKLPFERFKFLLSPKDAVKMVYPPHSNANLPVELISKLHGKEAPLSYRNIWYNSELDAFYRIYNGRWQPISEEGWLENQIRTSLAAALKVLKENVGHYGSSQENYLENYGRFSGFQAVSANEYYRTIGSQSLSYPELEKKEDVGREYESEENEIYPEDPSFSRLLRAVENF
jgi:hypothetical protein